MICGILIRQPISADTCTINLSTPLRSSQNSPTIIPGRNFRFFWRYLEFVDYDVNFYNALAAKGDEIGWTTKPNNHGFPWGHLTSLEAAEARRDSDPPIDLSQIPAISPARLRQLEATRALESSLESTRLEVTRCISGPRSGPEPALETGPGLTEDEKFVIRRITADEKDVVRKREDTTVGDLYGS